MSYSMPYSPAKIKARSRSKLENLDDLGTYDPEDKQSEEEFTLKLKDILLSSSTISQDPRLDHRDLPKARNYMEWLISPKFLGIKPFARQVEIGAKLFSDVCPRCSSEFYVEAIDHKWKPNDFLDRYQFFKFGRCPTCSYTRERGVRRGKLHDKYLHVGVAGQRCVSGDTLISTDKGFIRIEDYPHDKSKMDFQTLEGENLPRVNIGTGQWVTPSHFYVSDPGKLFKVTLSNGMYIEGTADHPILTENGFVKIISLNLGNKIALPCGSNHWPEECNTDEITAAWLGTVIAKGSLIGGDTIRVPVFCQADAALFLRPLHEKGVATSTGYNNTSGMYNMSVKLSDTGIPELARSLEQRRVPNCILSGTKACVSTFLRYLFNTGKVTNAGLQFSSDSSRLINDLHVLLLNFGIPAKSEVSHVTNAAGEIRAVWWEITIDYTYLELFDREIGFISEELRSRLFAGKIQFYGDTSSDSPIAVTASVAEVYSHAWAVTYDFTVPEHHRFVSDGLVSSNSSKCLAGSTLVRTPAGPVPISEVVRYKLTDVITGSGGHGKASNWFNNGRDSVYTITFSHTLPITCNSSHLFYVEGEGYLPPLTTRTLRRDKKPHGKFGYGCLMEIHPYPRLTECEEWNPGETREDADRDGQRMVKNTVNLTGKSHPYIRVAIETLLAQIYDRCMTPVFPYVTSLPFVIEWLEGLGIRTAVKDSAWVVDGEALMQKGFMQFLPEAERRAIAACKDYELSAPPPRYVMHELRDEVRRYMDTLAERFTLAIQASDTGPVQDAIFTMHSFQSMLSTGGVPSKTLREYVAEALDTLDGKFTGRGNSGLTDHGLSDLRNAIDRFFQRRWTMVTGIKPAGKATVYDITVHTEHSFQITGGIHVHNSVTTGQLMTYQAHRLIKTGDPSAYYSLLPGTELTGILTATTADNAKRNLYTPMANILLTSPWFKNFAQWCHEKGKEMGVELFRVKDTFAFFRFGGMSIRVLSPDRRRIRGSTAWGAATDELGHFDLDDDKVRAGGLEVFNALGIAIQNTLGAAQQMRTDGENDIIFPINHAISSPFDWSDPIMRLHKRHLNDPDVLTYRIPTWKFNPNLTKKQLRKTVLAENFDRDIGCEPPVSAGSFISDIQYLEACLTGRGNALSLEQRTFVAKSGKRFTTASPVFYRRKYKGGTLLTLDAGYNNNQYAVCVSHLVFSDNGSRKLVIDGLGFVQPAKDAPIHFTRMIRRVVEPIVGEFNVGAMISDRWQILQAQQDLSDEFGIMADSLRLKKDDFVKFREALYANEIALPDSELPSEDIMAASHVSDFDDSPVALLIKQALSVVEKPKTVDKGKHWSDDLFRVVVLAHAASKLDDIAAIMVPQEEDDRETATIYMQSMGHSGKSEEMDGVVVATASGIRSANASNTKEEKSNIVVSHGRR